MLSSPAPWGAGGVATYTNTTIMISVVAGVILAFLVLLTALSDMIPFKAYLILSAVFGAGAIAYSLISLDPGSTPAVLFHIYGAILIATALTVKIPQPRPSSESRTNPFRRSAKL
jgi:hypothetical protein